MIPTAKIQTAIQFIFLLLGVCLWSGCAATGTRPEALSDQPESFSALRSVGQAVSGQDLTDEQMHKISRQIQEDEETRSAIKTIRENLSGSQARVKYCPVCGRRYSPHLKTCPIHGVELKELQE